MPEYDNLTGAELHTQMRYYIGAVRTDDPANLSHNATTLAALTERLMDTLGLPGNQTADTFSSAICRHCGRRIYEVAGAWIDPNATGDDVVWRESCDAHDTFTAEHEPMLPADTTTT